MGLTQVFAAARALAVLALSARVLLSHTDKCQSSPRSQVRLPGEMGMLVQMARWGRASGKES